MSVALEQAFAALANEPRRQIVVRLCERSATISELRSAFSFSKQAMGKHVAVLEQAGLVRRRVTGRDHHLSVNPEPLGEVRAWIDVRTRAWQANFTRLHDVLGDEL